jgi:hypothetical protein
MTFWPRRPIMTAAELATHHVKDHGRDYSRSDDGYGDMEVNERRGFRTLSSWGADGWNLGDWPYLVLSIRDVEGGWELLSVCEGDHTYYQFDSEADLHAALDYLFLWYAAGKEWAPLTWEDRAALDAGEFTVEDRFRGPYRNDTENA